MINIQQAKELVEPFFKMEEEAVIGNFVKFAKNKGLKYHVFGDEFECLDYISLFIEGSRKDKVLLVAHVDTVFYNYNQIKPKYQNGLFISEDRGRMLDKKKNPIGARGVGIGADDRAGCAALWYLKELGHSILLTECEEYGCLGAAQVMANEESYKLLQDHQFAVQFDRKNRDDLVFYNVSTPEFEEYCVKETGYKVQEGMGSDIAIVCEDICGVNISIGYKNEHSPNEYLNVRWFANTLNMAEKWLAKENLPKFVL